MTHKAAFVNILGLPNAGKSTLMNALTGDRLSIITSKAQTTRHRILGIVNGEDFQIVFSDTPGIVRTQNKLHEGMMKSIRTAVDDADISVLIHDINDKRIPDNQLLERMAKDEAPVFLVFNKTDKEKNTDRELLLNKWQSLIPAAHVHFISALKQTGIAELFAEVLSLLPEHPAYYPKDAVTDRPERFFVAELVREQIFLNYRQEVPYATEVYVERFEETPKIINIDVVIVVERQTQKAIVIGRGGSELKKVGTGARLAIEKFLGKKVFLQSFVKVDKNWRNDAGKLKKYGY